MILHARKCTFHPLPHQYWRGLRPLMQLHEKRHMKCAGVAGRALRASTKKEFNFVNSELVHSCVDAHSP
ncbi:hypothetical protein DMW53_01680 [Serratia marcescens]|nr:hypothetical protein DMW53_01680 [Serratia marcescens]PYB21676.1 hypothetical protein DMW55_01680 [Serratia marcescens]